MTFKGIKDAVYVYTYPLHGIPEIIRYNEDGSYTILVDECLSREQQLELVSHALGHAANDADWIQGADVSEIEARAHGEESRRTLRIESEDFGTWGAA